MNCALPFRPGAVYLVKMSEVEIFPTRHGEKSEDAFAEIVRRYIHLIHSVARRRLGNDALAEEAAQLDRTMNALAHPTRRAILQRVMRHESRVTDLAAPFDLSLAETSELLARLYIS